MVRLQRWQKQKKGEQNVKEKASKVKKKKILFSSYNFFSFISLAAGFFMLLVVGVFCCWYGKTNFSSYKYKYTSNILEKKTYRKNYHQPSHHYTKNTTPPIPDSFNFYFFFSHAAAAAAVAASALAVV